MILKNVLSPEVIISAVFVHFCILLHPSISFSGRPLLIDDARPVSLGQFELELGTTLARPHSGGREHRFRVMTLTYGLIEGLEFALGIQRNYSELLKQEAKRGE